MQPLKFSGLNELVDQVLEELLPAALAGRGFALLEHDLLQRREAFLASFDPGAEAAVPGGITLLDEICEAAVRANRGGDLEAASEGVHATDVRVEKVFRVDAF